jgi:hypothetical protein
MRSSSAGLKKGLIEGWMEGTHQRDVRFLRFSSGMKAMELGGFEPPSSWVRFKVAVSTVQFLKPLICR